MRHYLLFFALLGVAAACNSRPVDKGDTNSIVVITNNDTTGTNNTNNPVITECGPGRDLCGGTCIDTTVDSANCGTCGNMCPDGTVCSNGSCAQVPTDCRVEGECPARYFCDDGTGLCEVGCSSNADCPAGSFCELDSHACLCTDEGSVVCGSECVAESPTSCGVTCETCPPIANGAAVCSEGACGQQCDDGYMMCDGGCSECPTGAGVVSVACLGNQCVASQCEPGHEICDGICASCPTTNGDESLGCDGQTCIITDCPAGTKLCDGVCADCPQDPDGSTTCQGDQCVLLCNAGFHSCGDYCAVDGDPDNCGPNCGFCDEDPNGAAVCVAGACGLDCDPDFRECQGTCAACPAGPGVVSTTCAGSSCVVASCSAGYEPCTGGCCQDAPDGVAYDYDQSPSSVSIALDSRGYPHIAFGSAQGNSIYYVYWNGSAWIDEYVTSGWDVSIKLDLQDRPHIAVWKRNPDGAWYAMRHPVNGWMLEEVDTTFNDVGMTPDLELVGNTPHIAYYDLEQDNLRYAVKSGGSWSDQVLANIGQIGFNPDLLIDNGDVHISCRDETNQSTRHVYDEGAGFVVTTVDTTRDSGNFTSLAVDADGDLHLAYQVEDFNGDFIMWNERENGSWGLEEFVTQGEFPSMVMLPLNQWLIVYQTETGTLGYRKFPQRNEIELDGSAFVAEDNEAVYDPNTGRVHVAYSDGPNDDIKYLSFTP